MFYNKVLPSPKTFKQTRIYPMPQIFEHFEKWEIVFYGCSFSGICLCVFLGICLIESKVFSYSCKLYLFPVCVTWLCFDWMSVAKLRSKCSQNTVIVATSSPLLSASPCITQTGRLHKNTKLYRPASLLLTFFDMRICVYCIFLYVSAFVCMSFLCVSHLVTTLRCDFHQVIMPRCVKHAARGRFTQKRKTLHSVLLGVVLPCVVFKSLNILRPTYPECI